MLSLMIVFSSSIFALSPVGTSSETSVVETVEEDIQALTENVSARGNLLEGKNNITISENFEPIYVKDFLKKYPEIEVISFTRNGESIGFINFMGGIGENFIIKPNQEYEFITKQETQINEI